MDEKVDRLFNILLKDITEEEVRHVIVGLNWTLVETNLGAGLAYTPAKDLAGCYPCLYTHLTLPTTPYV